MQQTSSESSRAVISTAGSIWLLPVFQGAVMARRSVETIMTRDYGPQPACLKLPPSSDDDAGLLDPYQSYRRMKTSVKRLPA